MAFEQKKKLAEWMGWKYHQGFFRYSDGSVVWHISQWNPDTGHQQFAEVWNKLSYEQKKKVLINTLLPKPKVSVWITDIVLNNLPAVMDAVLEVLELTGEKDECTES